MTVAFAEPTKRVREHYSIMPCDSPLYIYLYIDTSLYDKKKEEMSVSLFGGILERVPGTVLERVLGNSSRRSTGISSGGFLEGPHCERCFAASAER